MGDDKKKNREDSKIFEQSLRFFIRIKDQEIYGKIIQFSNE